MKVYIRQSNRQSGVEVDEFNYNDGSITTFKSHFRSSLKTLIAVKG